MATLSDYKGECGDKVFIECAQRIMKGDSKKLVMAYCTERMPGVPASSIRFFVDNVKYFTKPGVAFGFGNNSASRARRAIRSVVV